jgi:hypothetical protein
MINQTKTTVIFACPQCNLAHEVTQTHSHTKKAEDSIAPTAAQRSTSGMAFLIIPTGGHQHDFDDLGVRDIAPRQGEIISAADEHQQVAVPARLGGSAPGPPAAARGENLPPPRI